eukprot:1383027-Amphidinium_carterae.1
MTWMYLCHALCVYHIRHCTDFEELLCIRTCARRILQVLGLGMAGELAKFNGMHAACQASSYLTKLGCLHSPSCGCPLQPHGNLQTKSVKLRLPSRHLYNLLWLKNGQRVTWHMT